LVGALSSGVHRKGKTSILHVGGQKNHVKKINGAEHERTENSVDSGINTRRALMGGVSGWERGKGGGGA